MTATATDRATPTVTTPPSMSRRRRTNLTGLAFLAPFAVFFLLFLVWPVIYGFYLSLTGQSLAGSGGGFVGLANYGEALTDPDVWRSLLNTAIFTVATTVPLVVIALAIALLVNTGLPGQWLWRLSFFLPFLLASTVVSLFWTWMYNPQLGLINDLIGRIGFEPINWLQDEKTAMASVVVTTVWWTIGFNFLLYLAALQNIPEQQYEAAALDGANSRRQLFSITIPQLGPITGLIVALQVLASLKVFDQIYMMTNGGPSNATRPIVQYIYEAGFTGYRLGYASAISYIFFAIIVIISLVRSRFSFGGNS